MPNYDKFMKIKSAMESLQELVTDYEKDFSGDSSSEEDSEGADDPKEEASEGEALNDGGQSFTPILENAVPTAKKVGSYKPASGDKKKKMGLMVGMLKKKMAGMGA